MKERDILNLLNKEFEDLSPDASEELINAPIITGSADKQNVALSPQKKHGFFSFGKVTAVVAAIALMAGIVSTAILLMPQTGIPSGYIQNYSYISLSVNPSVSIVSDSKGKVVEITTKNRDAEILLAGTVKTELYGKDFDFVTDYLIDESISLGYFAAIDSMTLSAISCGQDSVTSEIVRKIKSGAESVLASKNINATVNASAMDKSGVIAEAQKINPELKGDEDIDDLIKALSNDDDYFQKFGGNIRKLFGDSANESVKLLFEMETFEDYLELLEDRFEFLSDLAEFNQELAEEETILLAFEENSGEFTSPDGWWLSWLTAKMNADVDEDIFDLAEDFAELFEDYEEYGLKGLQPLLNGKKPNIGAAAQLNEYLSVYDNLNFDDIEDYADELDDLLDDLNETNYEKIILQYDEMLSHLGDLQSDWNEFSASRGEINGVGDYLKKTKENFKKTYDSKKGSSANKL